MKSIGTVPLLAVPPLDLTCPHHWRTQPRHGLLYCWASAARQPRLWQTSCSTWAPFACPAPARRAIASLINRLQVLTQRRGQPSNTRHGERDHMRCIDRGQTIHLIKAICQKEQHSSRNLALLWGKKRKSHQNIQCFQLKPCLFAPTLWRLRPRCDTLPFGSCSKLWFIGCSVSKELFTGSWLKDIVWRMLWQFLLD